MDIDEIAIEQTKVFTLQSTVQCAKIWGETALLTHIPIVKNKELQGCFATRDLQLVTNNNNLLINHVHLLRHFWARKEDSVLDILRLFSEHNSNLLPILGVQKQYLGYYTLNTVLDFFASSPFLHSNSHTLTVCKNKNDYTFSEIAQIIETANGKLIGAYICSENEDSLEITLKIIAYNINGIIQTFRRYNYEITTQHQEDFYLESLKKRSDYLEKYLNP